MPFRSLKGAENDNDTSALEVIELVLYIYAIIWFSYEFVSDAVINMRVNGDREAAVSISLASIIFIFAFVGSVYKSYISLKMIDGSTDDIVRYKFIEMNSGIFLVLEKSIRLVIMALIILSPKMSEGVLFGIGDYVYGAFGYVLDGISTACINFVNSVYYYLDIEVKDTRNIYKFEYIEFHSTLEYYSSIMFSIAVLFLIWDILNGLSAKLRMSSGALHYPYVVKKAHTEKFDLLSYFSFVNVRHSREGFESGNEEHYCSSLQRRKVSAKKIFLDSVGKGRVLYLYFRFSPKFRERICLAFLAVFSFICSKTEVSIISVFFMAAFLTLYLVEASADANFGQARKSIATIPLKYFGLWKS